MLQRRLGQAGALRRCRPCAAQGRGPNGLLHRNGKLRPPAPLPPLGCWPARSRGSCDSAQGPARAPRPRHSSARLPPSQAPGAAAAPERATQGTSPVSGAQPPARPLRPPPTPGAEGLPSASAATQAWRRSRVPPPRRGNTEDDQVQAASVPRVDSNGRGVGEPLLRHHLTFWAHSFARDPHPGPLDNLRAPSEQTSPRASKGMIPESVSDASAAGPLTPASVGSDGQREPHPAPQRNLHGTWRQCGRHISRDGCQPGTSLSPRLGPEQRPQRRRQGRQEHAVAEVGVAYSRRVKLPAARPVPKAYSLVVSPRPPMAAGRPATSRAYARPSGGEPPKHRSSVSHKASSCAAA